MSTKLTRREFLGSAASLAASGVILGWLPPLFAKPESKELRPGKTWRSEEAVTLPEWAYGESSFSTETMLMFRGNPRHTFYGTGPLPGQLKILWKFRMDDFVTTLRGEPKTWSGTGWTGQASTVGGYVFVGSQDRHLYCWRNSDGALMWKYRAGRMFKGSLCIYKNRIYAPNVDDHLHCLDAASGQLLWRYDTGNDLDSSPCVVDGRLYVAGESGYVRCVDPENGKEHWKTFVGGVGRGTKPGSNGAEGSVAVDNGEIYVGNYNGEFRCLDSETGKRKWMFNTGDDTDVSAVLTDDVAYVAAEEASPQLFAIDRKTGKELWRFTNRRGWYSTPALVGDRLYIGGNDGIFYCINRLDGTQVWEYKAEAAIWCSPAVVDGKVLFGSYANNLYILSADSGAELQRIDLGGRVHSAPVVLDGRVYVGSAAGWFYCLGE